MCRRQEEGREPQVSTLQPCASVVGLQVSLLLSLESGGLALDRNGE